MIKNRLYCGDNLEILATMEKESVDLIYVDPPFFTGTDFTVKTKIGYHFYT
jgi:DNA modification methylase